MRRIRLAAATAVVASIVGLGMATPAPAAPSTQPQGTPTALQAAPSGGASLKDYVARRDARRHDASGQADAQQVFCDYSVAFTFLSLANFRYVSTELGYTGNRQNMLRARTEVPRAWELYFICFDETYDYILSVGADRLVSAELGNTGSTHAMLRARATVPDLWERFFIACNQIEQFCTIQSAQNGLYVSAELGYPGGDNGMLRARSSSVDLWEKFF